MKKKDRTIKYHMPITQFSPSVEKKIEDLDEKFMLPYLVLCAIISPLVGWYLGIQDWFNVIIHNFF